MSSPPNQPTAVKCDFCAKPARRLFTCKVAGVLKLACKRCKAAS